MHDYQILIIQGYFYHIRDLQHILTQTPDSARKQEYYLYPNVPELFSDTKTLMLRKHFPVSW